MSNHDRYGAFVVLVRRFLPIVVLAGITIGLRLIFLGTTVNLGDDWGTLAMDARPGLLGTLQYVWNMITGPPFPTILGRAIIDSFGLNLFILRLPSVVLGTAAVFLLYYAAAKCLQNRAAAFSAALLFSLSIPSLVFSQQIQPSIYYAFTTAAQLAITIFLVGLLKRPGPFSGSVYLAAAAASQLSLLFLGLNYMSSFIAASMVLCVLLQALARDRGSSSVMEDCKFFLHLCVCLIPWACGVAAISVRGLAYRWYLDWAYPRSLADVPRLLWDMLTYHLDFAYSEMFSHQTMGHNLYTIPIAAFFFAGVIFFCSRGYKHALVVAINFAALLVLTLVRFYPLGGVRHSLLLAPFVFLFVGYGIVGIQRILTRFRPRLHGVAAWAVCLYACGMFIFSGSCVFADRNSRLDVALLRQLCRQHDIRHIYVDIMVPDNILLRDEMAGSLLASQGISIVQMEICDIQTDQPFLYISSIHDRIFAKAVSQTLDSTGEKRLLDDISARFDLVAVRACDMASVAYCNDFIVLELQPRSYGQPPAPDDKTRD